ncbi:MAG: long-chain fatty acid--CoA ligase [Actinobacteria bacterium]|nr:long-chain fatty acid--CoA ligase [Actinomycetota bacterium]
MDGLIMDYQLTLPAILRRAEQLFGHKEIVTRLPDRSFHRYTYADFAVRAKRLALALAELGIGDGDRVGTLCWNHYRHLEAYYGIPLAGGVIHTLNLRLHPSDLTYIANHAGDRALIVDESLLPLYEGIKDGLDLEHAIVISEGGEAPAGMLSYEELIAGVDEADYTELQIDERSAAAMCYTSGTTGQPKGVLYSHRAIALQAFAAAMAGPFGLHEADTTLPVVPMFHANAWCFPFTCTLVGAKQVYPGPHLDPASLLQAFEQERVTVTAGVPTIWLGILALLDADPGAYDLSSLRAMIVGGSAAPRAMIQAFQERHGLNVVHAWGMTEMTPLGTVAMLTSDLLDAPDEVKYEYLSKQGLPVPYVEIRARREDGELVAWDGETMGELEVRGVWVASRYYGDEDTGDRWTADGWFKTGDVVTIDGRGCIEIQDRSKDLVKSGGEWISSVALENALMGHPAVAEAAVIAMPHEKWTERPLAVVVLKPGGSATDTELREYLASGFAKWWLPDEFRFVEEIPKTAVGKFRKTALREQFAPAPGSAEVAS